MAIFQNISQLKYLKTAFILSIAQIKGALSSLRQFLPTKSPLKMMKNGFYFTLKTLFILKIYKFLS